MIAKYLFFILFTICFGSFAWSVVGSFVGHSKSDKNMYNLLKLTSLLTWSIGLYELWQITGISVWKQLIAGILLSYSLSLFWWSSYFTRNSKLTLVFSQDLPKELKNAGPFRYLRHPFYSSYLSCYAALALINSQIGSIIMFIVMTCIYIYALKFEEKKFQKSDLDLDYSNYRKSTPALLPVKIQRFDDSVSN